MKHRAAKEGYSNQIPRDGGRTGAAGTEDAGTSTDGSCRIPADDEGAKSSGRAAETAYFH